MANQPASGRYRRSGSVARPVWGKLAWDAAGFSLRSGTRPRPEDDSHHTRHQQERGNRLGNLTDLAVVEASDQPAVDVAAVRGAEIGAARHDRRSGRTKGLRPALRFVQVQSR